MWRSQADKDREQIRNNKMIMITYRGYGIGFPYQANNYAGFMIYDGDEAYSVIVGTGFNPGNKVLFEILLEHEHRVSDLDGIIDILEEYKNGDTISDESDE